MASSSGKNLGNMTVRTKTNLPPFEQLAPRPRSVAETGLSQQFLCELIVKHLYQRGVLDQRNISESVALAWPVLEQVLMYLRTEGFVEVRSSADVTDSALMRYALTNRGRTMALDALHKNGYVGPAPVPLEDYSRITMAQSVHRRTIKREDMRQAFSGIVVRDSILQQLGPALHSSRPIFIYGPPGTGKTFIAQRLVKLLNDPVLVPYGLAVGDEVIQFFDPVLHKPVQGSNAFDPQEVSLERGYDPRYVKCERPVAVTGGELTLEMLELKYHLASKVYHAPLQLRANNGIFVVDDLGRQRIETMDLLNRWIIPLEERRDFLSLGSQARFPVPFDLILVFSTNLNPLELADEAFLRRLGYKVHFDTLTPDEYEAIWRQVCAIHNVPSDPEVIRYALELYSHYQMPLLPCHPRDLIGLVLDQCRYDGEDAAITCARLRLAWDSYFVRP
jgi:predicted ATPase with chaperone activity